MNLLLAAMTLAASSQHLAQCENRATIVDNLSTKYGETRQSVGLGADNALVEIFASNATGSWTITVTKAGGPTCLVASGRAFEKTDKLSVIGKSI
jgi:hypothetical protein